MNKNQDTLLHSLNSRDRELGLTRKDKQKRGLGIGLGTLATAAIATGLVHNAASHGSEGTTKAQTAINRDFILNGHDLFDAQIVLHQGVHARTSDTIKSGKLTFDGAEPSNDSFVVGKYDVSVERPLVEVNKDGDEVIAFVKPGISPQASTDEKARNLVYVNLTQVKEQSPTSIDVMPFDPSGLPSSINVSYREAGNQGEFINTANDTGVQSALYAVELHPMK